MLAPSLSDYRGAPLLLFLLWLGLMLVSLASRSFLPVDETRYVSVAWEMWLRGDFLVPHLNGAPYDHKPPLLFWLFHLGWSLFGVNEWWPRLVPPLFGLTNLYLTLWLARRLWPDSRETAALAPLILLGCFWWTVFTTTVMFDMLVTFFTLVAMLSLWRASRRGDGLGWLGLTLALGLGGLAKGPVILLHVLPLALLAPWWAGPERRMAWSDWYLRLLLSTLLASLITLAWAIPAVSRAGPEYQDALLFGQTAGRMVESFAHRYPFWWYLPWLPILFFPWLFWPSWWQAMGRLFKAPPDSGLRFCLAWLLPVFIAFCLISGKRAYYLLPLFPAFAQITARALTLASPLAARRWHRWPPAAALLGVGLLLLAVALVPTLTAKLPPWMESFPPWPGLLLMAGAGLFALLPAWEYLLPRVLTLTLMPIYFFAVAHLSLFPLIGAAQDMRPAGRYLGKLEQAGVPLAHFGKYHYQFHFAGRLRHPLILLPAHRHEALEWMRQHPDARLIAYGRDAGLLHGAEHILPYRGGYVTVWSLEGMRDAPYWR